MLLAVPILHFPFRYRTDIEYQAIPTSIRYQHATDTYYFRSAEYHAEILHQTMLVKTAKVVSPPAVLE